jgi:hypothetical protein
VHVLVIEVAICMHDQSPLYEIRPHRKKKNGDRLATYHLAPHTCQGLGFTLITRGRARGSPRSPVHLELSIKVAGQEG